MYVWGGGSDMCMLRVVVVILVCVRGCGVVVICVCVRGCGSDNCMCDGG